MFFEYFNNKHWFGQMVETEGLEKEKLKANLNRLKRKCSFFSFKCLGFEYVYKSLCEYDVDVEKKH